MAPFTPVGDKRHHGVVADRTRIDEHFAGPDLDPAVWTPSYLPAWSSRAASRATYALGPDGLVLSLPPEHPRWCPDLHEEPLRVSAVQTGNASGPVGSTQGQQPFRPGLVVREEQPPTWGYTPAGGSLEVRCRADVGPGSMFSAWLVGLEQDPAECGEICVVEVFGSTCVDGHAAVGHGIHPFRDPALHEEFAAPRLALDVARWHTYGIRWGTDGTTFLLDGEELHRSPQAPAYPLQLIIGLFDFPRQVTGTGPDVPSMTVAHVVGTPPAA